MDEGNSTGITHTSFFPRAADTYYPLPYFCGISTIVSTLILLHLYRRLRPRRLPSTLPGPKSYPFVGILPHVINTWEDWPEEAARLSHKYGRTWGGGLPNVKGLSGAFFFVVNEKAVNHVLSQNFENYIKGPAFRSLYGDLLGWGIFATDGDLWRVHRKVMSNMFSRNLLRQTSKVSKAKLHEVADLLRSRISSSPDGVANLDLQDIFFRMTFDITSYVAFGCEMDSFKADGQHRFACSFDEMQILITVSFGSKMSVAGRIYFYCHIFIYNCNALPHSIHRTLRCRTESWIHFMSLNASSKLVPGNNVSPS